MYSFALCISGARANILAVILLICSFFCLNLIRERKLVMAFFIIIVAGISALLVLFLLLGEKSDASIKVKTLHKISYMEIFNKNPLKTLFTGWGAGSEFYSKGFHKMTDTTELSFYETIRRYGIISTFFIFLFIWFRPVIYCFANKFPFVYSMFFSIILASYILVSCTNPFLLGSIGFCSLIFMETIIYNFRKRMYIR